MKQEYQERKLITNKEESSSPSESQKSAVEDEKISPTETEEKAQPVMEVAAQPVTTVDLLVGFLFHHSSSLCS